MSLINKMLQDLDARGTTRADGVPPEIKTVATGTRRMAPLRIAAIAAAVLVLAGGAVAWFVLPLEGYTYQPVQPQPAAASPPATVTAAVPAPVAEAPVQAPVAGTAPPVAADTVEAPPPPAKQDVGEPVRSALAERPRRAAPVATATHQAGGSTTSWAVASERARAERARLNARWQAERERLAALPPDQRRAGEVKLREEQARAAERAKIETAWLASLARREAGGADVPAAPAAARAAEPAAVAATPAARGQGRVETSSQGAENAYRRALASLQDGRVGEAIAGLQQTLRANPRHEAARQTLVSLLIENNRGDEAMTQLQQALSLDPRQPALAMLLARLQIERGKGGIETLQRTLPYATGNGEYHAFLGGALQRQGRLREAAEQYETALRTAPNNAVWWMGLGIALQGEKRNGEAADAFRQAKSLGTLSPDLQAFVERRLQQLGR